MVMCLRSSRVDVSELSHLERDVLRVEVSLGMLHEVDRDLDKDVVLVVFLEGLRADVEGHCLRLVRHDRFEVQPVVRKGSGPW